MKIDPLFFFIRLGLRLGAGLVPAFLKLRERLDREKWCGAQFDIFSNICRRSLSACISFV